MLKAVLAAMIWVYKLNTNSVVLGLNALEIKPVFKADQCENADGVSTISAVAVTGWRHVCQAMKSKYKAPTVFTACNSIGDVCNNKPTPKIE